MKKQKLRELSYKEKLNTQGGALGLLATIGGILYIAGEIAESAGRAYKKLYL